jgi:hypothetical protein
MNKKQLSSYIAKLKNDIQFNFDKDGYIAPAFLLINNKFEIETLSGAVETYEAKEFLSQYIIPAAVQKMNASVIITISEAWIKEFDKNDSVKLNKSIREYDDKIEIVLLNIETSEEIITYMWKIIREDDKQTKLKLFKESTLKYPNVVGRYTNFLHSIQANMN